MFMLIPSICVFTRLALWEVGSRMTSKRSVEVSSEMSEKSKGRCSENGKASKARQQRLSETASGSNASRSSRARWPHEGWRDGATRLFPRGWRSQQGAHDFRAYQYDPDAEWPGATLALRSVISANYTAHHAVCPEAALLLAEAFSA